MAPIYSSVRKKPNSFRCKMKRNEAPIPTRLKLHRRERESHCGFFLLCGFCEFELFESFHRFLTLLLTQASFPHSSHTQSSKIGKDLELQMACSDMFVLVHLNGNIKDTVGGATFQSWDLFLMNVDTDHQKSLLELKNLILANMDELGRKKISHMAYKLHGIIGPQIFRCSL
ncbi:hypothetical protein HN51_059461 [Arachis hypogaea]